MKKLDYNHLTTGTLTVDASHLIGVVNDLIDLVNSQQEAIGELQTEIGVLRNMVLQSQEAIEKLESKVWTADFIEKYRPALENLAEADTHRTVTLRIPKGMTFVESLFYADLSLNMSDNQAKKALDEVKGESNE